MLWALAGMRAPAVIELAEAGLPHIVYWPEAQPGSQLIAAHFGHAFCAALRNPNATVPEVLHACHTSSTALCLSCIQSIVAAHCDAATGVASGSSFSRERQAVWHAPPVPVHIQGSQISFRLLLGLVSARCLLLSVQC